MLGVDRDSAVCAELFDESDPAVLDAIERIVKAANTCGLTSSICGQAPSNRPELAELLIRVLVFRIPDNHPGLERDEVVPVIPLLSLGLIIVPAGGDDSQPPQ